MTDWIGRLTLVNFVGFVALAGYLGGDALNGFERDGHFFLKMGSRLPVEVSESVFRFMYWYAIVLFAHFALAIGLWWFQSRRSATLTS
jgi:hypothetical protein